LDAAVHTGSINVGETVGPYRVEAPLGIGGMGHVYRAVGPDGKQVALKVIKSDLARDEVFRRRFDREARIAVQVSHPNVVPVLDAGEHNGIPYMAQRFVGNGTLADRLQASRTLPLATTVRICAEIAAALDELHARGLIHRDVKPANILFDEREVAHITDFGLAKDTQGSVLTRPGQTLGSLDYMAPEQIRGVDVSGSSDVYALACVSFECVTGAPPFADRQGMRVLWAHLQDEPPDPRAKQPALAGPVAAAILRGLSKEPDQRPASAGAFAAELGAAAGG
jgi:serine/threonine protein kinase